MIPRPKFNIDEKNKGKGQLYNSMIPIKEESEESLFSAWLFPFNCFYKFMPTFLILSYFYYLEQGRFEIGFARLADRCVGECP